MRHRLRPVGASFTFLVLILALLPSITAAATEGVLYVAADTTLSEDHNGPIEITADNVALDCAGYGVSGGGSGLGIHLDGRSGVTVRNCDVSGFAAGIALSLSNGNLIEDNNVHDNVGGDFPVGIVVRGSPDNTIRYNVVVRNGVDGIHVASSCPGDRCDMLPNSDNNIIERNTVTDNGGTGIQLGWADYNVVTVNTAERNRVHGFAIFESDNNWISGNYAYRNVNSGFVVESGTGNTFRRNDSHSHPEWGFAEYEDHGLNTFSGNGCIENVLGGSNPSGLCDESGHFADDDASVFEMDIEWMAREGITKGCNPPTNDLFCPDSSVTRGQMSAFLVRALDLADLLDDPFIDDDNSVFEFDIERLAAAGITRGCNPPTNNRFCPTDNVTRGQMAAFLVRALGYTDDGGGNLFVDDDDSIFESDIDKLATAGVTRGCNPPVNNRFCPTSNVTRGQMAAFLHRALGWRSTPPP